MGNNQKQPCDNLQLFIEVPKPIYESGQVIQGKIHLNIKTQEVPYEKLILGFYCCETFLEKANKQTDASYSTSQKFQYKTEQTIHNFEQNTLAPGQYSYPFVLKLPQNLPTIFSVQKNRDRKQQDKQKIQIKYALIAQLNEDKTMKYANLTKLHFLNIFRPFRNQIQPLNYQKIEPSKHFVCFGGGTTKISIYLNKNFCFSGDIIQINGQVDNIYGLQSLSAFNCQLFQQIIVTNEKKLFYKQKQRGVLHLVKKFYVKRGNVENFSFSYKIPDYLEHSHSIGNYSALIYKLRFKYLFKNECDPNKSIDIPFYIQTKTPKLQSNIDQIPSTYSWNPTVKETINVQMKDTFQYNAEYPLEEFRIQLQKYKAGIPSFTYFNQMDAGYMTKKPLQTKEETNPYQMHPQKQKEQKSRNKIFKSQAK